MVKLRVIMEHIGDKQYSVGAHFTKVVMDVCPSGNELYLHNKEITLDDFDREATKLKGYIGISFVNKISMSGNEVHATFYFTDEQSCNDFKKWIRAFPRSQRKILEKRVCCKVKPR